VTKKISTHHPSKPNHLVWALNWPTRQVFWHLNWMVIKWHSLPRFWVLRQIITNLLDADLSSPCHMGHHWIH